MANEQNLQRLSTSKAREIGRKGGIKSGESRRRRKTYKELFEKLLSLPIVDEQTRDYLRSLGFEEEDLNNDLVEVVTMHQEVLKGNYRAYEAIRDTVGEKPTDKLQVEEAPVIVMERPNG